MTDEPDLVHEWICAALAARKDNRAAKQAWLERQLLDIEQYEERSDIDLSRIKLRLSLHLSAVIENEKHNQEEPTLCATPTT